MSFLSDEEKKAIDAEVSTYATGSVSEFLSDWGAPVLEEARRRWDAVAKSLASMPWQLRGDPAQSCRDKITAQLAQIRDDWIAAPGKYIRQTDNEFAELMARTIPAVLGVSATVVRETDAEGGGVGVKLGPFLSDAWSHKAKMGMPIRTCQARLLRAIRQQIRLDREMSKAKKKIEEAEAHMMQVMGDIEQYESIIDMRGGNRGFDEEDLLADLCADSDDGAAHQPKKARKSD